MLSHPDQRCHLSAPSLPSRPISGSFAAIIRPPERQPPRRDGAVGGPAPRQPSSASSVTSAHQRRRQQKLGGDALRSPPPPPPPPPPSEPSEPDAPPPLPACSHWSRSRRNDSGCLHGRIKPVMDVGYACVSLRRRKNKQDTRRRKLCLHC